MNSEQPSRKHVQCFTASKIFRSFSTLRHPCACASFHLSVQAMRGALESLGVDMSDDTWATAEFVDHLARWGGDTSVHTAHSWLVTALAESSPRFMASSPGVSVKVFTDPTILAKLPNGNDGLPKDMGVVQCHGIRSSKIPLRAVISGLF
jgi:hypothetical protein